MSGHVFHPGHEELHGITVVVSGSGELTYLGRYHEASERGVVLHDVAVHDPTTAALELPEWLAKQRKFGVQVSEKHLVVPSSASLTVTRFVL